MLDEEQDRRQELMSRLIVECSTGNNIEVLDRSTCMSQRETSFESLNGLVWSRCHKQASWSKSSAFCSCLWCSSIQLWSYKQGENNGRALNSWWLHDKEGLRGISQAGL